VRIDNAGLVEEADKVHDIVKASLQEAARGNRLPPQIRRTFDVEFDEDWNGDLAVWVWLHITDGRNPAPEDVKRLLALTSGIRDELIDAKLRHWPYVDVRPGP